VTLASLVPLLLLAQGVMGGLDTLLNHELIERLPYRPEARNEIGLHAIREAIYGTLFLAFAWFEWHGAAALLIALLLTGEVLVTATDEFVENRIRVLPQNERVMHVFLTLNLGAIIAFLLPTLQDWGRLPAGLASTTHGWVSWVLSGLALTALAWSVRDARAWFTLGARRRA